MAASEPQDVELTTVHVRRAITGNDESVGWLVSRLRPLLLAQVGHRLGPDLRALYDPQDLVQEAWLTLLPRLEELDARDGRFTPVILRFLSTTLLNKVNNLVKKHLRDGAPDRADGSAGMSQVAASVHGAVTMAMQREARDAVLDSIDELDEGDREILLMRGIEQQRNQTVAMLLDLSPQAVAMRYKRALERLREQLPGSVFDELED